MKLTHENLNAARTAKGGWTKAQLEAIGVAWPPANGWRHNVVGKEISDADYQRFCELASVRAKPNKRGESLLPEQPASMDSSAVLAWLNDKLEREGIARAELESRIVALHSKLDALRDEVREARRSPADHDSSLAPTLPQKTPTAPPWEV
jgi:hypothetical protein